MGLNYKAHTTKKKNKKKEEKNTPCHARHTR